MIGKAPQYAFVLAVALFGSVVSVGCGTGGDAKSANIQPGNMPDGESWTGVYYHPVFGYLHLVEQDTNVIGKWLRTDKGASGQLSGTKQGNVLHFQWSEHPCGGAAGLHTAKGKGVFVFKAGKEGIAELDGMYGLDDAEVGSDWHCVKQQRQDPELASAQCPAGEAPSTGGLE